eukprot:14841685-Alexandrium_andersonii.AAC.1
MRHVGVDYGHDDMSPFDQHVLAALLSRNPDRGDGEHVPVHWFEHMRLQTTLWLQTHVPVLSD